MLQKYSDLLFHPSFPTRRSSDLVRVCQPRRRLDLLQAGPGLAVGDVLPHRPVEQEGVLQDTFLFNGTVDRKSTRLNSSHVEISYAVFCLQKKSTKRWQGIG